MHRLAFAGFGVTVSVVALCVGCGEDSTGDARAAATDASTDRSSKPPPRPSNEPQLEAAVPGRETGLPGDARVAHDASQSTDGRVASDGGTSTPTTCVDGDGGGAAWPPGIPASAKAECVPHCDADQCGSSCAVPCDPGCCSANAVTALPSSAFASPFSGPTAAMASDSTGTLYELRTGEMIYTEYAPSGASDPIINVDCPKWSPPVCVVPPCPIDAAATVCTEAGALGGALLAVGGPVGRRVVAIFYEREVPLSTGRLVLKNGDAWTFENLAIAVSAIAVDSSGAVWIAVGGNLYRRNSAGAWILMRVPCGITISSLAADDTGALYVATGTDRLWRRSATGEWAVQTTPGVVSHVYAGAGTVHYARLGTTPTTDGGSKTTLYYGRLVGTGWKEHPAFIVPPHPFGDQVDYPMALDACGAPHFAVSVQLRDQTTGYYTWPVYYVRWTAAGWRSRTIVTSSDPAKPSIGVSTTSAELRFFAGSVNSPGGASVPLR